VVGAFGPSVHVVVADGGSKDRTAELARARADVVTSAPGRGRQLNAGAESAVGDVYVFLHADTQLDPGTERAIAAALAEPDVVGGCFEVRLRGTSADRPIARYLAAAINRRARVFKTATGDQAIFARRTAFEQAGGFPAEDLFEDVLFYKKLKRLGKVVVLKPAVGVSDRRWRQLGYYRTIATHLLFRFLFHLGVPPATLARFYRRVR
jgi:rSAM/selenodomain-associated transferase 2